MPKRFAEIELPGFPSKRMNRSISAKQAKAISARINKRFPYKDYGRAYIKRGSAESLGQFGSTFSSANAEQKADRKTYGYYGRGKYNLLKSTGRFTRRLGNIGLDALERKLSGRGLYTGRGRYNTLIEGSNDPAMKMSGTMDETEGVIYTHKEYIGDIFGPATTSFTNQSYDINPGLSENFPWLSQVAANYDEYEMMQCVFEYKSTIDASTVSNGQTGTIIIATQYNTDAEPFSAKDQMMQYHGGQSGRLIDDLSHGVECDPYKNAGSAIKRVRTGPLDQAINDREDYDQGRLEVAINNCPTIFANQAIGELWVYYTVKLLKPKLGTNRGESIQQALFACNEPGLTDPFGTSINTLLKGLNSLNVQVTRPLSNQTIFTFPAYFSGVVFMLLRAEGGGLTGQWASSALGFSGNVRLMTNLYAAGTAVSDSPTFLHVENQTLFFYLKIKSATGGVANAINIPSNFGTSITQTYCQILEVKDMSISNVNDQPKWFNTNNQQVVMS